ncbi:MAG: hypothetical protein Q4A31_01195 [Corynebacterium sp.]|uniref:hypothetical protein n=1 Tax=Corynebacterium sp. TaxID=1720 RepID=UPI0026DD0A99|nr:hypothetical protein [Corynebacterium sp.]MDO4760521.1 hypothetical protein [Corynebacterium sp.]
MNVLVKVLAAHPAVRLLVKELRLLSDLVRWIRGHILVPEGAIVVSRQGRELTLPIAITVASAIEIVVIELLLTNPQLRLILFLLSVYGVIIFWAYVAQQCIRPSYLTQQECVLRQGGILLGTIPLNTIIWCGHVRGHDDQRRGIVDTRLNLGTSEGTNFLLRLTTPIRVPHERWWWNKQRWSFVTEVALWADQPRELREHMMRGRE